MGYIIPPIVMDQMLYPQAKYFTPNSRLPVKTPSVEMGPGICQH